MNLRKIILAIFFIIALTIVFFVIKNWIAVFLELPPSAEIETSAPGPIDGAAPPLLKDKEITVKKETYPKQAVIGLRSWSDVEAAKKIITENGGKIHGVLDWPTEKIISVTVPNKEAEQKILRNSFWGKLAGGIGFTSFGNRLSGGIDYLEESIEAFPDALIESGRQIVDWGVKQMQADKVWETSRGRGVRVAILDTGVDPNHLDYKINHKGAINFTISNDDGQIHPERWIDDKGHGTLMSGIIAAADNGFGIVGVAPEAELYAVKVLGGLTSKGYTEHIISGIYWAADNGMDVANMSITAGINNNVFWQEKMAKALDYAYQKGVLLIGSAGNNGLTDGAVNWPAAYNKAVVAISAIQGDGSLASFSSYGPAIELTAPGVQITSTAISRSTSFFVPGAGYYEAANGTSVAAPLVTGLAALIKAKNPQLTSQQIRDILDSTAVDLGEPGRDESFGYGLVNAYDSVLNLPPVTISLTYPVGGEFWYQEIDQDVRWTMETLGEKVDKVDIELVHQKNDGIIEVIPLLLNAANSGSAKINVPKNLPGSSGDNGYFLAVSCSKDYFGKCQHAESGWLNIQVLPAQKLTVLYPNGGERWPQGTIQSVVWNANYFGGANIDVTLLEKKPVPQYSLVSQSGSWDNEIAQWSDAQKQYWTYPGDGGWDRGRWEKEIFTPDTCDGKIGNKINDGIFVCPEISTSKTFSCLDVAQSQTDLKKQYYKRTVTCNYQELGDSLPVYSLVSGNMNDTYQCYNPEWCVGWPHLNLGYSSLAGYVSTNPNGTATYTADSYPPDTCDGNPAPISGGGRFSCPTTNSTEHLQCVNVNKSGVYPNPKYIWLSKVDCAYRQTGTKPANVPAAFQEVPAQTLAENIFNIGSVEIKAPSNLSGDKFRVQLSCNNFIGECPKELSDAPFSIVRLADPKILTINKFGIGAVTDGNIYCVTSRGICEENYEKGQKVTLTARSADPGMVFTGWSGNSSCSGTGPCQIIMDSDQSVTAKFAVRAVTVTAIADQGSIFTGWSGACLNNGQCFVSRSSACATDISCNITMSSDQLVSPNFIKGPVLQIHKPGNGTGTVIGQQINCGSTCSATYGPGDLETLSATADSGSIFTGWSGACSGTGTCNLTMNSDKSVTANFNSICVADTWTCTSWLPETCPLSGTQTRTCVRDCPSSTSSSPPISQSCAYQLSPGQLREVKP